MQNISTQLTAVDDPAANYDYVYDNLSRLIGETQDIAGLTPDIEFAHAWNANSRRTALAAEIGGTADFSNTYAYDNLSRLTQVIQQDVGGGNTVADKRVDFAYNGIGQYTTITRYQSTSTSNLVAASTFTYDTRNRLTDLDHKQNSTNLALYDFTYDAMDRILSMTHSVDGTSNYTYDKESQLTAGDHPSPQADESFSFDATGNRTGGSYDTDPNNQTVADGTYTYQYDDEGNRTRRTKNSDSSYEEYSWDHRNRLTQVTFKNSGGTVLQTVAYAYDAFDRWIRRTHDSDGPGGSAATDLFWAFDGQSINPSLQFDGASASNLDNRYLFNPDHVDQILADEDVSSLGSAGNVLWPLTDHLGTTRDLADLNEGSGVTSVTNHRFFEAFGALKSESNAAVDCLFAMTGKPLDELTGLQNNWQRWLDTFLNKWLSEDPIGFIARDPNLVRVVANNAVNEVDPTGLVVVPGDGHHLVNQANWEGMTEAVMELFNRDDARIHDVWYTFHSYAIVNGHSHYVYNAEVKKELIKFLDGRPISSMTTADAEKFLNLIKGSDNAIISAFNRGIRAESLAAHEYGAAGYKHALKSGKLEAAATLEGKRAGEEMGRKFRVAINDIAEKRLRGIPVPPPAPTFTRKLMKVLRTFLPLAGAGVVLFRTGDVRAAGREAMLELTGFDNARDAGEALGLYFDYCQSEIERAADRNYEKFNPRNDIL